MIPPRSPPVVEPVPLEEFRTLWDSLTPLQRGAFLGRRHCYETPLNGRPIEADGVLWEVPPGFDHLRPWGERWMGPIRFDPLPDFWSTLAPPFVPPEPMPSPQAGLSASALLGPLGPASTRAPPLPDRPRDPGLVRDGDVARFLGVTDNTLLRMVRDSPPGLPVPWIDIGGGRRAHRRWKLDDVAAWARAVGETRSRWPRSRSTETAGASGGVGPGDATASASHGLARTRTRQSGSARKSTEASASDGTGSPSLLEKKRRDLLR